MNRQRYRLVFSPSLGGLVPAAESARGRGKSASGARSATALLGGLLLAAPVLASHLGLTESHAFRRLSISPGLIARGLGPQAAQRLFSVLSVWGWRAWHQRLQEARA